MEYIQELIYVSYIGLIRIRAFSNGTNLNSVLSICVKVVSRLRDSYSRLVVLDQHSVSIYWRFLFCVLADSSYVILK